MLGAPYTRPCRPVGYVVQRCRGGSSSDNCNCDEKDFARGISLLAGSLPDRLPLPLLHQRDHDRRRLQAWLRFYNFEGPHRGYRTKGRTPASIFFSQQPSILQHMGA